MSPASSSSPFLGYNPPDDARDSDRTRISIGRPIIPRPALDEFSANLPSASSSRRRSIPNQAQSSTTVSRPPQLQQRPLPRRATHTPSSSITSSRRTSLPTILHPPSTRTAPPLPVASAITDNANSLVPSDDIYSNLSTFTFGAARANLPRRGMEHISPFTVSSSSGSDRTPRPSVSGPSSGGRTPRVHPTERVDDEDEEEAARQTRSKMRAIDDGSRRPSLPINAQSGPSSSPSPPRHETDSDAELESAAYDDGEELDTDVEFDYRTFSREDVSDTASQHTFGGGTIDPYAPSRHGDDDRLSMAMSLIEPDDEDEPGDPGTSSPVTFARVRDSSGESGSSRPSSPSHSRRGSIPWNIPGATGTQRDRESSEATILGGRRMSRSADNDLGHSTPTGSALLATSQPTIRPDWHTSEGQVQVQIQGAEPTQEEEVSLEPITSDAYEGFNLQYVLGDPYRRSWSSGAPSYIAPVTDSRRGSIAPWEAGSISSGRRSSTTTMSDDPFTSQLRKSDKGYGPRRDEWSFKKEVADGASPASNMMSRSGRPAIHELWRHEFVGRFKVDKQWTEHPSKMPTQRINVRHIPDPFSRGNTRGGPHSIIHRHSRAVAFSIFRKYGLFGRSAQKTGGSSFHVHTSGTILLAPMDVQTQFTSTRTTSQLNTYGHLSEESSRRTAEQELVLRKRSKEKERDKDKDKDKDKEKPKEKPKDKEKRKTSQKRLPTPSATSDHSNSQTASMSSTSSYTHNKSLDDDRSSKRHNSEPPSSPSVPVSPTLPNSSFTAVGSTNYAPSITTTAISARESMDTRSPSSSIDVTMSPGDRMALSLAHLPLGENDMDLDEDEEDRLIPRTSHAEAFATLDSGRIDYIRTRAEHHPDHDHAGGIFDRLTRRIRGQNIRVSSGKPSGASTDVPFTSTAPPWVTLAPRSKQEERERVIQNLSESFKDVGLLPTFKTNRGERTKGKQPMKNIAGVNVFEDVPSDALHMLLPLWPGKTDEHSAIPGQELNLPVEERQYLIVYYVPFDERKKDKKKGDASKKRSRADSVSASSAAIPKAKGIPRAAFRVCARLVGCHDFLGTGVRLPSEGLCITGPMDEALRQLPSPSLREQHPGESVIGVCSGRDRDVEFVPEGLARVGLCSAVQQHEPPPPHQPPSPVHEEEMMDAFDPVYSLTPIGRAAVEMAWLGCLAIMFSDVSPPSTK
ncbi:hypothetical protein BD413DRAFT_477240 [Trametes elegans]|nr:hypothetical protein BD413DRAFT_477240 [Trametes elegans]